MYRAIILDFDGVICESVDAKTDAFRKLFEGYPDHVDRIARFHIRNSGMSRFEKFKIIYRDFFRKELTAQESASLGQKFSEYCFDNVVKSPFVKGAIEFIRKYHKQYLLFIVSGTPQDEILEVVKQRGLERFFVDVYGSPRTKSELIKIILNQHNLANSEVIFVGDAINDYHGARDAGVKFVGRVRQGHANPFEDVKIDCSVSDMRDLEELCTTESV